MARPPDEALLAHALFLEPALSLYTLPADQWACRGDQLSLSLHTASGYSCATFHLPTAPAAHAPLPHAAAAAAAATAAVAAAAVAAGGAGGVPDAGAADVLASASAAASALALGGASSLASTAATVQAAVLRRCTVSAGAAQHGDHARTVRDLAWSQLSLWLHS